MTKVHRAGGDKCRGEDENRGFESGEEAEGGVRHQNIPCRATAGSPVWLRPIWEQRKRRMAQQKRKVPEVTEKKNKKLKKASAEGPLLGPEAVPSVDGASSKREGLTVLPRLVLNSWAQVILPPQLPTV
ncbi:protein cholesin isoform X6 [Macaca fascicularis]|uniref:protein cholesin isoform X6 n=1 Tax=Macaca fascicularis TaxID=9541 RepID=UPI003D156A9F